MHFKKFNVEPVPLLVRVDDSEFSDDIQNNFHGKRWDEVTLMDWISTASIQVVRLYMSPQAFKYYLPSILISSANNISYLDWGLKALLPDNAKYLPKGVWWQSYYQLFENGQRQEICLYLAEISSFIVEGSENEYLFDLCYRLWGCSN